MIMTEGTLLSSSENLSESVFALDDMDSAKDVDFCDDCSDDWIESSASSVEFNQTFRFGDLVRVRNADEYLIGYFVSSRFRDDFIPPRLVVEPHCYDVETIDHWTVDDVLVYIVEENRIVSTRAMLLDSVERDEFGAEQVGHLCYLTRCNQFGLLVAVTTHGRKYQFKKFHFVVQRLPSRERREWTRPKLLTTRNVLNQCVGIETANASEDAKATHATGFVKDSHKKNIDWDDADESLVTESASVQTCSFLSHEFIRADIFANAVCESIGCFESV